MEASGNLKRCRGKTLSVKVRPTANAQYILEKGVTKHANHDKKVHEGLDYVLLYPDHSKVVKLPGTTNEFILEKYREDVGKAFNRITLFIASRSDFLMAELPTLDNDIVVDLDDNIYLETSVFANMESTEREIYIFIFYNCLCFLFYLRFNFFVCVFFFNLRFLFLISVFFFFLICVFFFLICVFFF